MANQPLRSSQISIGDDEIRAYRLRLAHRLRQEASRYPRLTVLRLVAAGCCTLLALAAVVYISSQPRTGTPQPNLEQLRAYAVTATPQALETAASLAEQGRDHQRWNALMVLFLSGEDENVAHWAAQGLVEDPRSEFRFTYLEYLLDQADEYHYSTEAVERLLDREQDRGCQRLLTDLLRLTT